ncbi:MAG: AAA family ATPase [Myxococcota bacterium]
MNLLELDLKAFGPFTDRRLVLSEEDATSLCVIYGPNEAGKSSVLRAVHDLLYGIPARSTDNFVHDHPKMRVGGRLRFAGGEELAFMRRKAIKQSVYDYADKKALKPEALSLLTAATEAVPEETFNRFFGLDRARLANGSRELFEGGGEVGHALLGARLGVSSLRPVIEGLEAEAAELFTARGSKPLINAGLKAWKEAESEIKANALEPREWQAQSKAVEEAAEALAAMDLERASERAELVRLERLQRALPALAKRSSAMLQLGDLPEVAQLSADFETRLTLTRATLKEAAVAQQRAETRIETEQAKGSALLRAPSLLAERERIEILHQRIDGYRKSREDLPRRERELAAVESEIDAGLRLFGAMSEIGGEVMPSPDRIRELQQAVGRSGRVEDLAGEFAKFRDRLEKAVESRASAQGEIERLGKLEAALPPVVDLAGLQSILVRARKMGAVDERIDDAELDRGRRRADCERRTLALGLDSLGEVRLEELLFPAADAIANAARRCSELEQREGRIAELRLERGAEYRSVEEGLARLRGEGAVPSEQDLAEAREGRDLVWRAIREELIEVERAAPSARRTQVADEFERAETEADHLADRLRVDADRVARQSSLEAQATRLTADLSELETESTRNHVVREELDREWRGRWEPLGLEARPAEELGAWRRDLDDLLERRAELEDVDRATAREREQREAVRLELALALDRLEAAFEAAGSAGANLPGGGAPGRPSTPEIDGPESPENAARLELWVECGEAHLRRLEEAEEGRRRFENERREAEEKARQAERAEGTAMRSLETWQEEWRGALEGLGLAPDTRPNEARERLGALRDLMAQLRSQEQVADRVAKIRIDIERFEAEVAERVLACAPDLADFDSASAALRLQRMLGDALEAEARAQKVDESLQEAKEEREEAIARLRAGEDDLERLRKEARVADAAEIDEALRSWRVMEETRRDRDEAVAQLEQLADGRPIDELEEQSRALDPDLLVAEIEQRRAADESRAAERDAAIEKLTSARNALAAMDGGSVVAELGERAQGKLASVRRDIGRYVELRLAREILKVEVERAQEENQSPLLASAGRLLSGLTMGAYASVLSDEGADGRTRLLAVDREGREVPVDALSEGTRDQLFLALRLAALEESLERTEPMPLIADDILVEFDDARTPAALEVLAGLAGKTQILLFSHHQFVADAAARMGGRVRVVEL